MNARRMTVLPSRSASVASLVLVLWAAAMVRGAGENQVEVLTTPSGVEFGILGKKPAAPAPTLFVFANTIKGTLTEADYNRAGQILAQKGYLCVALDIPSHGKDQKAGEPAGLNGWNARLGKGEDFLAPFVKKATSVLDHLIKEGYTDPDRVAACGTSRGGFIALHFAAAEPRVKWVAAFAPVSDLRALTEFKGKEDHELTKSLAVIHKADKLAGRGVWLCIGNNDERVNTDDAIAFTRAVVRASAAQKKPTNVELHVMPSPGHSIHKTAHEEVAAWVDAQVKTAGK